MHNSSAVIMKVQPLLSDGCGCKNKGLQRGIESSTNIILSEGCLLVVRPGIHEADSIMGTHFVGAVIIFLLSTAYAAPKAAVCIHIVGCRMNSQIRQHGVLNLLCSVLCIRKARRLGYKMEILIKHRLEAAILTVGQHILPVSVFIRPSGMMLFRSELNHSCRFCRIEVVKECLGQRCRICGIISVGTINTDCRRCKHHFRKRICQVLWHFSQCEGVSLTQQFRQTLNMRSESLVPSVAADSVFSILFRTVHGILQYFYPGCSVCLSVHQHRSKIIPSGILIS